MGIHVTKENDPDLYNDIAIETQRLLTISEEIRISVKKVDKEKQSVKKKVNGHLQRKRTTQNPIITRQKTYQNPRE